MYLCNKCTETLTALLLAVPGLVHDLIMTRSRLDVVGAGRNGGKSAETPMYIRLTGHASTVQEIDERNTYTDPWHHNPNDDQIPSAGPHRKLEETIVYWGLQLELRWREEIPHRAPGLRNTALLNRTLTPADDGRLNPAPPAQLAIAPLTATEVIAVWIAHNPQHIRRFEYASRMYDAVDRAVQRARRAVDRPPEVEYVGPCPRCANQLFAETDTPIVRCRRCRNEFDVKKVVRAAVKKAEDDRFTMARIARYLEAMGHNVPRGTLHTWHYRGRLKSRGFLHVDEATGRQLITPERIEDRDPPVFRFGDVLRLVERTERIERTTVNGPHRQRKRS